MVVSTRGVRTVGAPSAGDAQSRYVGSSWWRGGENWDCQGKGNKRIKETHFYGMCFVSVCIFKRENERFEG